MPVLGGSTRHYKAYGKRSTNIVNRRADLAEPDWARSDSDDSDDEDQGTRERASTAASSNSNVKAEGASKPHNRSPFEIVLDAPAPKDAPRRRPAKGDDKENSSDLPAAVPSLSKTSRIKAGAQCAGSGDEVTRSEKAGPAGAKKRPALLEKQLPSFSSSSAVRPLKPTRQADADISWSPVVAPRRAKAPPRVVSLSSSSEASGRSVSFMTPPRTPSPIVSDLSSLGEEPSFEDDLAALSARRGSGASVATSKEAAAAPVAAEGTAFLARRRSRRSTAASVSASTSSSSIPSRRLPSPTSHPVPPQLAPLLPHLLSSTIYNFTSFVSSPLAPLASNTAANWWTKVGEASYSEVFATAAQSVRGGGGGTVVVKIIPIANPALSGKANEADEDEEELPFMSDWTAVQREIQTSRTLGGEATAVPGFVRYLGTYLVQGSYPEELLASWDDYKAKQTPPSDEQIRPHVFTSTQLYALILLEHAGTDLESYKLKTWKGAASVFAQAVEALARAEEACGFEHRDLHWGNILLRPKSPNPTSVATSRLAGLRLGGDFPADSCLLRPPPGMPLSAETAGITATLIDFTLSRCVVDGCALFDEFEDEDLFKGTGDEQYDVYRRMRQVVESEGGGWGAGHLRTNVLWLHYLVKKLLHGKRLKPPPLLSAVQNIASVPSSPRSVPSPRKPPFSRRHSTAPTSSSRLSSSSSSSMPAAARRSRTHPAGLLAATAAGGGGAGRKALLGERDLEIERSAHEWLEAVESELERVIVREWGLEGARGRSGSKGKKAAGRGKAAKAAEAVDASDAGCTRKTPRSAGELADLLFGPKSGR